MIYKGSEIDINNMKHFHVLIVKLQFRWYCSPGGYTNYQCTSLDELKSLLQEVMDCIINKEG